MIDDASAPPRPGANNWPPGTVMSSLSTVARNAILTAGRPRSFSPGARLLVEGEETRHILLLTKGVAKITVNTIEGRTALLAVRVSGDVVGEIAAMAGGRRIATVTAAGLVQTRVIGHQELTILLARQPQIAQFMIGAIGAKLQWANQRRVESGAFPVDVKVARMLLDLVSQYGRDTGHSTILGFGLTQPELAALIGSSEPAAHRALTSLRQRGVVSTGYREIEVLDLHALRRAAEVE